MSDAGSRKLSKFPRGWGGGGSRLGNTKTLPFEKLDVQTKMLFKHKERPWEVQSPM